MTADLTPRQKSVLDFILSFQRRHGMAPTVREIGQHLGLRSPSGIHRLLNVLKDKGYLLSEPGKNRSWRFAEGIAGNGIALAGTIAAGDPLEAIENTRRRLAISPAIFGSNDCFALRVQGDSMIEAHIMDGDLAIIRPGQRVENGQIGAVLIQGMLDEATLKIVHRTRTALTLAPANPAYSPLVFKGPQRKQVSILGCLAGLVRRT